MEPHCPLCDRPMSARRAPRLYGTEVCRKCRWGFFFRRLLAFLIDWIGFVPVLIAGNIVTTIVAIAINSEHAWRNLTLYVPMGLAVVFCCKDGFGGYSPGKRIVGVRVVHKRTGQPIGPTASFKRNLPFLIPFLPLIALFQLPKGARLGDGMAQTMVIWEKYSEAFVFPESVAEAELVEPAGPPVSDMTPIVEDGNPYRPPLA